MDLDERKILSNKFSMEWPRKSGIIREFPEVDTAGWFEVESARKKILKGQQLFIDRLLSILVHPKNNLVGFILIARPLPPSPALLAPHPCGLPADYGPSPQ